MVKIENTLNQSGTASFTDLFINRTETSVGSGGQYFIDAHLDGLSRFAVDSSGNIFTSGLELVLEGADRKVRPTASSGTLILQGGPDTSGSGPYIRLFGGDNGGAGTNGRVYYATVNNQIHEFKGDVELQDTLTTTGLSFLDGGINVNNSAFTVATDGVTVIDVGSSPTLPGLTIEGGGGIFEQTFLRLYDKGSGSLNRSVFEFSFANSGPSGASRIVSESEGTSMANGANLILEAASAPDTFNTDQLVLSNTGEVSVSGQFEATSFLAGDGTSSLPSYSFSNDTNTGIYRYAENRLGLTASGAIVVVSGTRFYGVLGGSFDMTQAGSEATPTYSWKNYTDMGMFRPPGVNAVAFSIGGSEAMRIHSNNNVGIGETAPTYKLDVNGDGRFAADLRLETLASSASYTSGILGAGTIWNTDSGAATFFEVDNMRVRNEFRTHIFKKDIVRASNGYLLITDVAEVTTDVTITDSGTGQTINIKEGDSTFSVGDLLWAKAPSDDGTTVYGIKVTVTAIGSASNGEVPITVDAESDGGGELQSGDVLVRVSGGYIMNDASSQNAPFMAVYDDVSTWSEFQSTDKEKARLGNITGIVSSTFGSLEGYGLYTRNVYLEGNAQVAGTLTAGDAAGVGSTFYAGRIRKNLIADSENLTGTSWTATAVTVAEVAETGPFSANTKVYEIVPDSNAGTTFRSTNVNNANSIDLTSLGNISVSAYLKQKDHQYGILFINDRANVYSAVAVDLTTGDIVDTGEPNIGSWNFSATRDSVTG